MASPPFNINQTLPGDSDIVSQHPPNARSMRDTVESWLLVNHDTNGNHARIDIPRSASPTTPAASIDVLYVSTTGRLIIKHPDGSAEFVGTPPGVIEYSASPAAPTGWLYANGGVVSRATYPDLYIAIGTAYGNGLGDGLTFSLPDLRGRMPVGADDGANRISLLTFNAVTTGGTGGSETRSLVAGNIPSGVGVNVSSLSVAVSIPSVSVTVNGSISGSASGQTASGSITGTASGGTVTGTASGTVSGSASVTSSDTLVHVGGASDNYTSVAGTGTFNTPTRKAITSSGTISGSISATSLAGTLSGAATVTGSFSGSPVSTGTVSGTFSGSGSGSGTGTGTGTGSGTTTGTPSGTAFSIIPASMVLFPIIKT